MRPNNKHSKKEIKSEKIIRIGVICTIITSFIALVYWNSFYRPNQLENNHRYTVGRVFRINPQSEGDDVADFDYYFKGKKYSGSFTLTYGKEIPEQVGDRYYVKLYPPDPENCYILLDKTVPDSLKEIPLNDKMIPAEGWGKIP